ncbi:MAG: hypothetical protein IPJ19_17915 [Planctomycetes bacterium]|nr:hypothetical protein [Planctomycetota bacterium]
MNKLRSLLYKEWRDQRALTLGALALLAMLLAAAKLLAGKRFDALLREDYVYPVCLGIFAVALATETITRDASNGVERTLLRLPATRMLAWFAKLAFALLACLGCGLFLIAVERVLRLFEQGNVSLHSTRLQSGHLTLIACAASACLAAACVVKRSLPAVITGIAALASAPLLALWMPVTRATVWLDLCFNSWRPAELASLATFALLVGGLLAFCVRRRDPFGLRRAAGAVFGVGIVLVPAFAASARESAWALDIVPFSPRAEIWRAEPSPDGRYVAVQAEQTWTPREDWLPLSGKDSGTRCRVRHEVWLLDRETGRWSEIDDRDRRLADSPVWDAGGRLATISMPGTFGDGEWLFEHIDPRTLAIQASHPADLSEALGHWCEKTQDGDDWVLRWRSRHIDLQLSKDAIVAISPEVGIVFHEQDGSLVRHELATGGITKLAVLGGRKVFRSLMVSPDGSLLYLPNERKFVDACDGHMVRQLDSSSAWMGWSRIPGRICTLWHLGDEFTALNEDGSETPMPARGFDDHHLGLDAPAPIGGSAELGRGRFLLWDQQRIECMKLDGSEREVLYQARP